MTVYGSKVVQLVLPARTARDFPCTAPLAPFLFCLFTRLFFRVLFLLYVSQFPDGENYRDVFGRLESLLLEMVAEPQPVVVVAHLAVLRVIYGWASHLATPNCSPVVLH